MKLPMIALLCCLYTAPAAFPAGFQTQPKRHKIKRHKGKKHRRQ
jgi:hypothetical protein